MEIDIKSELKVHISLDLQTTKLLIIELTKSNFETKSKLITKLISSLINSLDERQLY